jgi:glucokinase
VGYGKAGSFEGFCSGAGLAQIGKMLTQERIQLGKSVTLQPEDITAKTLAEAALGGDELALEAYCICGEQLGRGLAVLVDVLNPERIVIGSVFARAEQLLRPAMEKALALDALAQSCEVCRIVPAQLGDEIGDYAALAVAFSRDND